MPPGVGKHTRRRSTTDSDSSSDSGSAQGPDPDASVPVVTGPMRRVDTGSSEGSSDSSDERGMRKRMNVVGPLFVWLCRWCCTTSLANHVPDPLLLIPFVHPVRRGASTRRGPIPERHPVTHEQAHSDTGRRCACRRLAGSKQCVWPPSSSPTLAVVCALCQLGWSSLLPNFMVVSHSTSFPPIACPRVCSGSTVDTGARAHWVPERPATPAWNANNRGW